MISLVKGMQSFIEKQDVKILFAKDEDVVRKLRRVLQLHNNMDATSNERLVHCWKIIRNPTN
jgi:hypothetical protein